MEKGIYYTQHNSNHCIKLVGELRFNQSQALEQLIALIEKDSSSANLELDLCDTQFLDSTMLGMIGRMGILFNDKPHKPILYCNHNDVRKGVEVMGVAQLFEMCEQCLDLEQLDIIQVDAEDKEKLKERVLKAHEALIKLDKKNQEKFDSLINQLKPKGKRSDD